MKKSYTPLKRTLNNKPKNRFSISDLLHVPNSPNEELRDPKSAIDVVLKGRIEMQTMAGNHVASEKNFSVNLILNEEGEKKIREIALFEDACAEESGLAFGVQTVGNIAVPQRRESPDSEALRKQRGFRFLLPSDEHSQSFFDVENFAKAILDDDLYDLTLGRIREEAHILRRQEEKTEVERADLENGNYFRSLVKLNDKHRDSWDSTMPGRAFIISEQGNSEARRRMDGLGGLEVSQLLNYMNHEEREEIISKIVQGVDLPEGEKAKLLGYALQYSTIDERDSTPTSKALEEYTLGRNTPQRIMKHIVANATVDSDGRANILSFLPKEVNAYWTCSAIIFDLCGAKDRNFTVGEIRELKEFLSNIVIKDSKVVLPSNDKAGKKYKFSAIAEGNKRPLSIQSDTVGYSLSAHLMLEKNKKRGGLGSSRADIAARYSIRPRTSVYRENISTQVAEQLAMVRKKISKDVLKTKLIEVRSAVDATGMGEDTRNKFMEVYERVGGEVSKECCEAIAGILTIQAETRGTTYTKQQLQKFNDNCVNLRAAVRITLFTPEEYNAYCNKQKRMPMLPAARATNPDKRWFVTMSAASDALNRAQDLRQYEADNRRKAQVAYAEERQGTETQGTSMGMAAAEVTTAAAFCTPGEDYISELQISRSKDRYTQKADASTQMSRPLALKSPSSSVSKAKVQAQQKYTHNTLIGRSYSSRVERVHSSWSTKPDNNQQLLRGNTQNTMLTGATGLAGSSKAGRESARESRRSERSKEREMPLVS